MAKSLKVLRLAASGALRIGLPAGLALFASLGTAQAQCAIPPAYTNITSSTAGDLTFTMGTDGFMYTVGDPVQFWLSVYNSGSATVTIPNPYSITPLHYWRVLPDSCPSPYESEGCQASSPFYWPTAYYFFGVPISVAPGECKTYTTSWDGAHQGGGTVIPAIYKVTGGFDVGDTPTSQGYPVPELTVHIQIAEGVPVMPVTWSAIKTRAD